MARTKIAFPRGHMIAGGLVSIESLMFFGIGFLLAALFALAIVPAVHARAVRLARQKYEIMPVSMNEIQAERDQLRAKFAISTRNLETSIEALREKAAMHAAEVARKAELVGHLKTTLEERAGTIGELAAREQAMQARESGLFAQLHAAREEAAARAQALDDADRRIARMSAEAANLNAALAAREQAHAALAGENAALKQQANALNIELVNLKRAMRHETHWRQTQDMRPADAFINARPQPVALREPVSAPAAPVLRESAPVPLRPAAPAASPPLAPLSIADALAALKAERGHLPGR